MAFSLPSLATVTATGGSASGTSSMSLSSSSSMIVRLTLPSPFVSVSCSEKVTPWLRGTFAFASSLISFAGMSRLSIPCVAALIVATRPVFLTAPTLFLCASSEDLLSDDALFGLTLLENFGISGRSCKKSAAHEGNISSQSDQNLNNHHTSADIFVSSARAASFSCLRRIAES